MKKIIILLLMAVITLSFSACSGGSGQAGANSTEPSQSSTNETPTDVSSPEHDSGKNSDNCKILVAYFSATGNTESVAQKLAEGLGADIYEIVPEIPYTDADLNYGDSSTRATKEQNDPATRPTISGSAESMEKYDVVFIGYPIWWGEAPRIMNTFIESYDFSGKTLVPFCTSGSSGFGNSDSALKSAADSAKWLSGKRFSAGASTEEITEWANGLGLNTERNNEEKNAAMQLKINDTTVSVEWESNESVEALKAICADSPLTVQMSMYGGFEQVGSIGQSLPKNDVLTTTQAGDIVLYSGNQIVVFYGSNAWAYTRLGRITDKSAEDLESLLGNGNVTLTIEVEK